MAALYQLTDNSLAANAQPVIRESDGANIPNDPRNADYQRYLIWLAVPNTPDQVPAPPAPTIGEIYMELVQAGITVTGNSNLVGTYQIAGQFQDGTDVLSSAQGVYLILKVGGPLPGGGSTFNWSDSGGAPHAFTAAQFETFFEFFISYRYDLSQQATEVTPVWPTATVNIA